MTEEELIQLAEPIIKNIYNKRFSSQYFMDEEDLKQEARIKVLLDYRAYGSSDVRLFPLIAIKGMLRYLENRYHWRTKKGYAETAIKDNDIEFTIPFNDTSTDKFRLCNDIATILAKYSRGSHIQTARILGMAYQGYSLREIADIQGVTFQAVQNNLRRLGRHLLKAWSN